MSWPGWMLLERSKTPFCSFGQGLKQRPLLLRFWHLVQMVWNPASFSAPALLPWSFVAFAPLPQTFGTRPPCHLEAWILEGIRIWINWTGHWDLQSTCRRCAQCVSRRTWRALRQQRTWGRLATRLPQASSCYRFFTSLMWVAIFCYYWWCSSFLFCSSLSSACLFLYTE